VSSKNAGAAVRLDKQGFIGNGLGGFHARRTGWHGGNGQAESLGFFLEQALDVGGGNMAFDDVVADPGGVAGTQAIGHTQFFPRCRNVVHFVGVYLKTILLQVFDPFSAATALGTLEHFHLRLSLRPSGAGANEED